jgi:hypothetical protein
MNNMRMNILETVRKMRVQRMQTMHDAIHHAQAALAPLEIFS